MAGALLLGWPAIMVGGPAPACAAPDAAGAAVARRLDTPPPAVANPLSLEAFDAAWRTIAETHFDSTYGAVDWNAVREELRPRAAAAATLDEGRAVIREMLARLGQSHFELIAGDYIDRRQEGIPSGEGGPGFTVRVLDGEAIVFRVEPGTPAERAGVRPGWIVRRAAGHDPARVLAGSPASLSDSRRAMEAWLIASRLVSGNPGGRVEFAFVDGDGVEHQRTLDLVELPGETAQLGYLPPFRTRLEWERIRGPEGAVVGVIRFNVWMLPAMAAFDEAVDSLRSVDGIVIDLRGNVGGVAGMLIGIAGHFYTERVSLGAIFGRAHRLEFNVNPRRVNRAGETVEPYTGPVAVLIDRHSYSASEFFAGGLQGTGRARVFGQRSDGYALAASFTRLPGGDVLEHAVSDFTTASGRRLEANGVVPDEIIPLTRADLLRGVDAPLEAAIRWIEKEKKNHD